MTLFERISEKGKDKIYELFASNAGNEDQYLIVEVELEGTDQDDGATTSATLKTRKNVPPGSSKLKIGTKKFSRAVTKNEDVSRRNFTAVPFNGDPSASIKPATTLFLFPFPVSVAGSNEFVCAQPPINGTGAVGNATHKSDDVQNRYAVDFTMPMGTEVFAMRNGVVVAVQDSHPDLPLNAEGRSDPPPTDADEDKSNFVRIRHDDGTFAVYAHLQQNGAAVAVGDVATAGATKLALSGNSGNSTGPHLHVAVLRASHDEAKNETTFVSLSFKFKNTSGKGVTPGKGQKYKRT
jgi:murein DD-endopeptidase MepM/ murein hydrolase activator NlpD